MCFVSTSARDLRIRKTSFYRLLTAVSETSCPNTYRYYCSLNLQQKTSLSSSVAYVVQPYVPFYRPRVLCPLFMNLYTCLRLGVNHVSLFRLSVNHVCFPTFPSTVSTFPPSHQPCLLFRLPINHVCFPPCDQPLSPFPCCSSASTTRTRSTCRSTSARRRPVPSAASLRRIRLEEIRINGNYDMSGPAAHVHI